MKNKVADIPYGGLDKLRIQSARPIFNEVSLGIFKYYVKERYHMHILKDVENKPFPYTEDIILSMYRFTNVRREHDKNTKYLIQKLKQHSTDFNTNIICNIMLFRMFNKIETMEMMGGWVDFVNYNEDLVRKQLSSAPDGYVYFTNAYLSSGMKKEFNKYFTEEHMRVMNIPNVINKFKKIVVDKLYMANKPQDVIEAFKQVNGIHDFLSYQLFVDCTYLEHFPWSENEFVVSGPGCELGLNYLFSDRDGLSDEELLFWLRDNCPITRDDCEQFMIDLPNEDRYMNVMSLENCMCELGKYLKTYYGVGRPRSRYKI